MSVKDNITAVGRKHRIYPSMLLESEFNELEAALKAAYLKIWGKKFLEEDNG